MGRALAHAFAVSAVVLAGVSAAQSERRTGTLDGAASGLTARECMARAMYFESNRSHEDGMLAVGTVVANRLASARYGDTVCEVVGRRSQFAPGVLTRAMTEPRPAERARRVAEAVLKGRRHPVAGTAMFFHTANVPFRNDDKNYVLVSGGNAFYQWNRGGDEEAADANLASLERAVEAAPENREIGQNVVTAALRPKLTVTPPLQVADMTPQAAPQAMIAARPARPEEIQVAAETYRPAKVAPEIVAAPNALETALAYRAAPRRSPVAADALVAMASLRTAPLGAKSSAPDQNGKGRRVVAPAAPVLASAAPALREPPTPPPASAAHPMANMAVAQAWSAFQPILLASN